jgi:hypothetical protein
MHQELLLTPVQYSRIQNHAAAGVGEGEGEGEGEDLDRRKRSATSQPPSCSSNFLVHLMWLAPTAVCCTGRLKI